MYMYVYVYLHLCGLGEGIHENIGMGVLEWEL